MKLRPARALLTVLAASSVLALYACGAKKPPPKAPETTEIAPDAGEEPDAAPPPPASLHERLGGKDGLAKIVDTLMKNAAAHDKLKKRFGKVAPDKLEKYKGALATALCDAAGGACTEAPADGAAGEADAGKAGAAAAKGGPKDAFKGLKMTDAEWDPFVASFKAALDENGVGETEQADLIALLAPMRDDLVDAKKK